tara:strand:+ start:568 stop:774 length:207 start_codon:yes stop_codon:yes gene_type:complete
MNAELTHLQKELLLELVKYYMSQDLRRHVMRELPSAYNAWMGRTVVKSEVIDTGFPIIERLLPEDSNV